MVDAQSYAALTWSDPNPLKRMLQRRRLADALRLARDLSPLHIVDYGAGDGALLAAVAKRWPDAELVCFEPVPQLARQARGLLANLSQARVVEAEEALPDACADLLFCTEVFEHLPPAETSRALAEIGRVLAVGGRAIIGVPVELGPPALAKGLFRLARRAGAFDARARTIAGAALGRPAAARPQVEISPGRPYYPHHAGFDHRPLMTALAHRFARESRAGSPFPALPAWANSELYVRLRKRS